MASPTRFVQTAIACLAFASLPAFGQTDAKSIVLKHLRTSRDFTLKVAEQMPEADYGFKLTPPQMSFAEQMAHIAQDQAAFLAPFSTERPSRSAPASMNKKDVIAFVRQTYDANIDKVSKLTQAQIDKSYDFGGPMTGLELLMFLLDHSTHHRASAEMYLRAKGITPAEYQF